MQRIAILRLIIANLRDYSIKYETSCFYRMCHKHTYRYLKGWKSFRRIITRHTGLRISDVLYCSCWFRKCRRNSSKEWKMSADENTIKVAVDTDLQQYSSMGSKNEDEIFDVEDDDYQQETQQQQQKE